MARALDASSHQETSAPEPTSDRPDPVEKIVLARAAWGELGEIAKRNMSRATARSAFRRILFSGPRRENTWRSSLSGAVDGRLNPEKVETADAAAMALEIKEVARFLGAGMVGICRSQPAFVYPYRFAEPYTGPETGKLPVELKHSYAISLGIQMDLLKVRSTPSYIDNAEVGRTYAAVAWVACELAAYIRELGYPARAHHTANELVCQVPIAVQAGLGELGRNGILVSGRYGPRLRLATVTTDLPLATDSPVDLGVDACCQICKKCADNCPARAIPFGDKSVYKGIAKWKIDQTACVRFWTANPEKWSSCNTCIKDCPWSKPDVWYHHLATKAAARTGVARRFLVWLDDRIYGKHPYYPVKWLGYSSHRVGRRD